MTYSRFRWLTAAIASGSCLATVSMETLAQALAAPDVRARLTGFNMDPMISTPEAFTDFINAAIETWGRVLKRANIAPQ